MSFALVAWAQRQRTGSPTRKAVLVALADSSNGHTRKCCPSVERIAYETEFGVTAVKNALKDLVEAGFITRERNRRQDGSLGTYSYTFPETAPDGQPETGGDSRPGTRGVSQEEPGSSEPGETTDVVSLSDVPKAVLVNGRNLPMDALAKVCRVEQRSQRYREVVAAVNGTRGKPGIREQCWRDLRTHSRMVMRENEVMFESDDGRRWVFTPERFEEAVAASIERMAQLYLRKLPGALLTPSALAKWWADLPGMDVPGGGTPFDAALVAEDELRRMGR